MASALMPAYSRPTLDPSMLDDSPFIDDVFSSDVPPALSQFASSPIFSPHHDDPVWPISDDAPPTTAPLLHDDPAALPHYFSHDTFDTPELRAVAAPPPSPPLSIFGAHPHSPPVNSAVPLQPPAVSQFAHLQLPSHLPSAVHNCHPPPQQSPNPRSVSPSSNNNRVTHTVSGTTCHTSPPPTCPSAVNPRVNNTLRKKRQSSSSRASRVKSAPQLVMHPSRTQQPLQQPLQQPPHPSQNPVLLSKSPPPQLSCVAQIPSSTTPTTAATPSTTNSVQRSPPRTPYSIAPSKPLCAAPPPLQPHPAIRPLPNTSSHPSFSAQLSSHTVLTNSASNLSKSHFHTGSTSTKHAASHAPKQTRTTKPRDKLSRVAKLLKCRTKEQLVEQMLSFIRASEISEDVVREALAPIDVPHYISQCRMQYNLVYQLLSERQTAGGQQNDTLAFHRCKQALMSFKNLVVEIGRMFIDASAWMDVLRFCVRAAQLNAQLPQWPEQQYNKSKCQLHNRLEQFAARAATALSKPKQSPLVDARDLAVLVEMCRPLLPSVAAKLGELVAVLRPVDACLAAEQLQLADPPNTESSAV